jgi:hypothetical protein
VHLAKKENGGQEPALQETYKEKKMTEYQALDGRIANHLINGMALSYRRMANGSMIVIAPNGMKLIFGAEKVKVAEAQLQSAELPRRSGKGNAA